MNFCDLIEIVEACKTLDYYFSIKSIDFLSFNCVLFLLEDKIYMGGDMKTIIMIFAGTLLVAIVGQSLIQADCQYQLVQKNHVILSLYHN